MADAVVIGSGPNGLVAANLLADAGWEVLVLEAQPEPGGAVRSAALTEPGFAHDVFSSFYPFAQVSPPLRRFGLERHGLRWRRHPLALAHPDPDGGCASLSTDLDETAASLDAYAPGDGQAWRALFARWQAVAEGLVGALFTPFPPVRAAGRVAAAMPPAELLRFARFLTLPVRRMGTEHFRGAGGRNLLAGNALHADLAPEDVGSGAFGWILTALGQEVGFPVPEGGSSALSRALVRRLEERGGRVVCSVPVTQVLVRRGRAAGVRTAEGDEVGARRAVLADVDAPTLYRELVAAEHLPGRLLADLDTAFAYDHATVKVDWALDGPVPWTAPDARRAGTVHVTAGVDELTHTMAELNTDRIPARPFLIFGQYALADPTRQPAGRETAWAYAHVPRSTRADAGGELSGRWDDDETARFADRMEERLEAFAPGFRRLVRARHVLGPGGLEAADANLVGGAINGGTAHPYQLALFRPVPAHLGRPESPLPGLYLASASAHPAGGVHGAPGANAARAALAPTRLVRAALARTRRGGRARPARS
ncbi:MAG: NAD(P)/FAD-dependent oxidoreductase [Actinomycetota bacterium]|nr:NAD(P)/FAD-dependent oxidoreductase [Actinomycetota bacterium]